MAKYISIPLTSNGAIPNIVINTDMVTTAVYKTSTTLGVWAFGKEYQFTAAGVGAVNNAVATANVVAAINSAMLAQNGPSLINIAFPTGTTVTGFAVA